MLAIVAAIRRELAGIETSLSSRRPGARQFTEGVYGGWPVVLSTTGPGKGNAAEVVSIIANSYSPSAVICLGYAGAASEALRPGDLVLYSRVALASEDLAAGETFAPRPVLSPDPSLEENAGQSLRRARLPFHRGQGVTVFHSLGDPESKRRLGRLRCVLAIDMESYWVAEAASRNHLPFLGIRAISDPVAQRVPDLAGLVNEYGDISIVKTLAHALTHPTDAYPMVRLAWNTRLASRNLATFVSTFLASYSEGPDE